MVGAFPLLGMPMKYKSDGISIISEMEIGWQSMGKPEKSGSQGGIEKIKE